ncbi:MAG TPA: hypothetical protein VFZ48_05795 [Candidatus Saccharimonadales bacterium]
MNLLGAALIASFGQNSLSPARAATIRLGGLLLIACGLGWLGRAVAAELPAQLLPGPIACFWASIFIAQILCIINLLLSAGVLRAQTKLIELLHILPMPTWKRWGLYMIPAATTVFLTLLSLSPSLLHISLIVSLPTPLTFLALLLGGISALGLFFAVPRRFFIAYSILLPALASAEYITLRTIIRAPDPLGTALLPMVQFTLVVSLLGLLFIYSRQYFYEIHAPTTDKLRTVTAFLPRQLWFLIKLLRAPTTRLSLAISSGVCFAVTVICAYQQISDVDLALFLLAMFSAAFASDIRALSRALNPAEITALRGTLRFLVTQFLHTAIASCVIATPLIYYATMADLTVTSILGQLSYLLLGVTAGLFVSTLIMPGKRDVLGQFSATALCVLLLYFLPKHTFLQLGPETLLVVPLGYTALLFYATYLLEKRRNNYNWRHPYVLTPKK